jgi:hypothetical protein
MQFIAIGWSTNYPPSYIWLANLATVALIVVVLIEAGVYFRKRWKNRKK